MLGHEEQVSDSEPRQVVVHQDQAWIVAGRQTLAHRAERPIDDPGPEPPLLAFQFEFFGADAAEEIRDLAVARELKDVGRAAVGTEKVRADPLLGPDAGVLRRADERRRGLLEAQVQRFIGHPP